MSMDDWEELSLRDAGVRLLDCVHKTPPAVGAGLPYVAIPDMKGGEIVLSGTRRISSENFTEWTRKTNPQPFDIVLSRRCNPGETAYVRPGMSFALGQNLVILRADGKRLFPPFLRWLVRTPQWWNEIDRFRNVGAVFDSLRLADVPNFRLLVPPRVDQTRIASILGALDDKIELHRRMNETLEAMARALFKDWFVDFGPTRAKQEGVEPYLAPELWSLFPERLDAGGRPEGWHECRLQDIVNVNPTEPLKKGIVAPYLDMAALPTSGAIPEQAVLRDFSSGMRFRNGDTLFARITPCLENGKTAFVQSLPESSVGWGSTEFIVLRATPPVPAAFTYLLARHKDFRAHAIQSMTGTSGRQRARNDAVTAYPFVNPNVEVWSAFGANIEPLFQRIRANGDESRTLAQTRDLLLPKLMSGEIRIQDAEKAAEAVL
jgi:type I restriction enzyme, S subunit